MGRPTLQLYGVAKIDGRLREMTGPGYSKVLNSGLRAGIKVIVAAQKAIAPYPSVKAAIGSRLLKRTKEGVGAKAGAGVGKKFPKGMPPKGLQGHIASRRPGVGISARNIHWYILGTAMRSTGSRRVRSKGVPRGTRVPTGGRVHSPGRMPANPIIKQATLAVVPMAIEAMNQTVRVGVNALWKAGQ